MTKEQYDDFIARGGQVTRCPPGEAKTQSATFARRGQSIVPTPERELAMRAIEEIKRAKQRLKRKRPKKKNDEPST